MIFIIGDTLPYLILKQEIFQRSCETPVNLCKRLVAWGYIKITRKMHIQRKSDNMNELPLKKYIWI